MREISFLQLTNENFNINRITTAERWWKNENVNNYPNGRSENVLSYTAEGGKQLFADGSNNPIFSAPRDAVLFISQDCRYSSKTITENDKQGHTFCVKFKLVDEDGEELCIREKYLFWNCSSNEKLVGLFRKIISQYLALTVNYAKVKCTAYQILNTLLEISQSKGKELSDFEDILPAIKYIESNYNLNTSVDELAKMCLMSNSYFRKRFCAFTGGDSYTNYRNKLRIKKAEELLSDSMWTINAISQVLGFYDTSHFYKIYRKFTGKVPNRS